LLLLRASEARESRRKHSLEARGIEVVTLLRERAELRPAAAVMSEMARSGRASFQATPPARRGSFFAACSKTALRALPIDEIEAVIVERSPGDKPGGKQSRTWNAPYILLDRFVALLLATTIRLNLL